MKHITMLESLCTDKNFKLIESCDVHHKSRQCRNPFPLSQSETKNLFELIHMDVWGPYHGESITNTQYILTIVEDYSRATWTFLMSSKLRLSGILKKKYIMMIYDQFGVVIKRVRSDNNSEFLNNKLNDLFAEKANSLLLHSTGE